jgi:hypothetical protein
LKLQPSLTTVSDGPFPEVTQNSILELKFNTDTLANLTSSETDDSDTESEEVVILFLRQYYAKKTGETGPKPVAMTLDLICFDCLSETSPQMCPTREMPKTPDPRPMYPKTRRADEEEMIDKEVIHESYPGNSPPIMPPETLCWRYRVPEADEAGFLGHLLAADYLYYIQAEKVTLNGKAEIKLKYDGPTSPLFKIIEQGM